MEKCEFSPHFVFSSKLSSAAFLHHLHPCVAAKAQNTPQEKKIETISCKENKYIAA